MLLPLLLCLVVAVGVLIASLTSSDGHASPSVRTWRPFERGTAWAAVTFAAVAAASLLLVPFYETLTVSSSTGPTVTERRGNTLLSVNGLSALVPVLFPVLLAAIPLFRGTPHQRRVRAAMMAVLLVGFTILAGFSIGLFFVPSAIAMLALATFGAVNERTA